MRRSTLLLGVLGVAAVGGVVYVATRPAASSTASVATPAVGSITTLAQWNALTPAQQTAYATAFGSQWQTQLSNLLNTTGTGAPYRLALEV